MKKIFSLFLSAILCFAVFTVPAHAEEKYLRMWRICDLYTATYWHGVLSVDLKESALVRDQTVGVAANESLVIRKNTTLMLGRGAKIDGTVYIQKGGKLRVTGGELIVSATGSILADGHLSIGKRAALSVRNGGELFVGTTGRLSVTGGGSLRIGDTAAAVCVGKTNAEDERLGKKLLAVCLTENGETVFSENPEAELPTIEEYHSAFSLDKSPIRIVYLFENGVSFTAVKGMEFDYIGRIRLCNSLPNLLSERDNKNPDVNPGGGSCEAEIKEIDGKEYAVGHVTAPVMEMNPDPPPDEFEELL